MLVETTDPYCESPMLCDVIPVYHELGASGTTVTYLEFIISRIKDEQE